ncbi:MAG: hypothetical protein R3218_01955, partial [Christiangramia sp.]|nr:hypothetical protein [Christiangramia sp.]
MRKRYQLSTLISLRLIFSLICCSLVGSSYSQLSGTYSIGGTGSHYSTINEAVNALNTQGVNGPVVFKINSGIYYEQILIGEVAGSSSTNTITFESTSGNAEEVILTYGANNAVDNYIIHFTNASNIILRNLSFEVSG